MEECESKEMGAGRKKEGGREGGDVESSSRREREREREEELTPRMYGRDRKVPMMGS